MLTQAKLKEVLKYDRTTARAALVANGWFITDGGQV